MQVLNFKRTANKLKACGDSIYTKTTLNVEDKFDFYQDDFLKSIKTAWKTFLKS